MATLLHARTEAETRILLARATAEEHKAEASSTTWLTVQMHAYDALGKLGGDGTTILIGDWARLPNFLFPHAGAFANAYNPYGPTTAPSSSPLSQATPPAAANPNVPAGATQNTAPRMTTKL